MEPVTTAEPKKSSAAVLLLVKKALLITYRTESALRSAIDICIKADNLGPVEAYYKLLADKYLETLAYKDSYVTEAQEAQAQFRQFNE